MTPAPRLTMSRPGPDSPWVLWGGLLPSGSLKYLTFRSYLDSLTTSEAPKGLVEMSEGCTALALEYLARQLNVPCAVLSSPSGERHLRSRGYAAEAIVASSPEEAVGQCMARVRDGWHWPRQMTNPKLVDAVRSWVPQVLDLIKATPGIDRVACGFGTGATLAGLAAELRPAGYTVKGLMPPPGVSVPGWRNYAEQNLGEQDLFRAYDGDLELVAADVREPQSPGALGVLLAHRWGVPPESLCIVSHDGVPD